ncbi:hypothetical protein ABW21_db0207848 [Orbilia brochopaga]|nr:hypothetical protein ABW21_db0207848 [Drechslerella brochopaga]
MKFSVLLSLTAAGLVAATGSNGCNANNCLRAVRESRSSAAHFADCTSAFWATETPPATTVFPTWHDKRDEGSVPGYATACDDFGAYASACSCFGAPTSTVVLPVPTVTGCPFKIKKPARSFRDRDAWVKADPHTSVLELDGNERWATWFLLVDGGKLISPTGGVDAYLEHFGDYELHLKATGGSDLTCSIDHGAISCSSGGKDQWSIDEGHFNQDDQLTLKGGRGGITLKVEFKDDHCWPH